MAKEPKKTLYHSELVNLGPVEVDIKSDVKQSQYPNQNDYVIMVLDGYDRNYSCENDQCADALVGLQGKTVILEAIGSRDDAEIIVSEPTGGRQERRQREPARRDERQPQGRQERATPQRGEREPRQERRQESRQEQAPERPATETRRPATKPAPSPDDIAKAEAWAIHHFKQGLGRFINAEIMIHQAAVIARDEIKARTGYEVTEAGFQAMTSSAWIFLKDTGKTMALPSKLIPKAGAAAPKQSQAPTESRRDDARQEDGRGEAQQPGPHEPPPDDDVPF